MNESPQPAIRVGPIHYQILCGAGLVLIFFAQFDQGLVLGNLLVVCVGVMGLVSRMRAATVLLLIAFAAAQIGHHLVMFRTFEVEDRRPFLHIRDLVLAIGLVAYLAANYRLQGLTQSILPVDPRQRQQPVGKTGRRERRESEPIQQKRTSRLLTPQEIAGFVLMLPLWALAGQALWIVIAQRWSLEVFPVRFLQLITFAWLLIVGVLVVGTIFTHWRRRQMDPTTAQVYLQDVLWRETRREQRRIFRWLAWRRLHERTEDQSN